MTEFTQDKIFKNVNQEDARILLNIMGKNSKKVKIWTKELRLLDPKDYKPDIIVELDNENLIIELQSTKVNDEFSKRALTFVSITNRDKDNDKEVNLMVLSSAENSKTVHYRYNFQNVFNYDVVGLEDLDVKQIINNVEPKIINNDNIIGHDLVLYALLPIIDSRNMEKHIRRVVNNLLKLKYMTISLKELSFGIEWLIVDKYVSDEDVQRIIDEQRKYPVSRTMYSSEDTVYIDIEALLSFFYSAVLKRPWTNTVITVAGDCVKRQRNIEAPIGTPIGDILNFCGLKSRPKTVILGGSMTGYMVDGIDTPVLRSTKAILAFEDELSYESTTCIGCGKCIDVCPEELLPYYIYTYYLDNNIEKLYMLSADKCTELLIYLSG